MRDLALPVVCGALLVTSACSCHQPPTLPCPLPQPASSGLGHPLAWRVVTDHADLAASLSAAQRAKTPVAIEVWAGWCGYCNEYHQVIDQTPGLRSDFKRLLRLRIDVTDDAAVQHHNALRDALGIPRDTQPFITFVDARGSARHDLDVPKWYGATAAQELKLRTDALWATR